MIHTSIIEQYSRAFKAFLAKEARTRHMTTIRPLQDRIIVKRAAQPEMIGRIVVPDAAREKGQEAEIIAVGPGKKLDTGDRWKPDVEKGQHVLLGKYSGTEVTLDGEDYVIIREDDILGVIETVEV